MKDWRTLEFLNVDVNYATKRHYPKNNGDDLIGPQKAREWLASIGANESVISHVCQIIEGISFKGAGAHDAMPTIEGTIVKF